MTWGSFVDFWLMREMGHEDAIMRNYDIMHYAGKGCTGLHLALRRIGIGCPHVDEAPNYVPEVIARLEAVGFPKPSYEQVRVRLVGWYTWDRIRKGDIRQWFVSDHVRKVRA